MAKILRENPQEVIDAATEQAEGKAFNMLRTDFSKELLRRFHEVKDTIEDWTDVIAVEALVKARLKTLADKETWTENNLIDMALISCILWNIEEIE